MSLYKAGEIVLDEYVIEALIGEGGFGQVYRARAVHANQLFALKILHRDGLTESMAARAQNRFMLEARLGLVLKSQEILRVFRFSPDAQNGRLILVMEYAPGGSLADRLRLEPVHSVPETLKIALDIAAGLAALHEAGVVHRDIKPGNILFDSSGRACIGDLGLAQVMTTQQTQSSILDDDLFLHPQGTPAYMSPEQEHGSILLSPSSDVYSLGVILFEMLSGRAYRTMRPGTRLKQLRPDVPEPLDDLVARMLSEAPQERPWDGAELVQALKNVAKQLTERQEELPREISTSGELTASPIADLKQDPGPNQPAVDLRRLSPVAEVPKHRGAVIPIWLAGLAGLVGIIIIVLLVIIGSILKGQQPGSSPIRTETGDPTSVNQPPACTQIDQIWVAPIDGMTLVCVPAGEFLMGSQEQDFKEYELFVDELPQHRVYLDAYWIDITEITKEMFSQFVDQTGYVTDAETIGFGERLDSAILGANWREPIGPGSGAAYPESYPVVQVSWNDAQAYCEWTGRQLPSEAQWEKAARGTQGGLYPWGNTAPSARLLNFDNLNGPVPVGSYAAGASPYGALDMAGNVREWCQDWHATAYYTSSPDDNPTGPAAGTMRVTRGGDWNDALLLIRTAARFQEDSNSSSDELGFRCAIPANP